MAVIPDRITELPCPDCGELIPVTMKAEPLGRYEYNVGVDRRMLELAVGLHVREAHTHE